MRMVKNVVITSLLSVVFVAGVSYARDIEHSGGARSGGGQQDGRQLGDQAVSHSSNVNSVDLASPMEHDFTLTYLQLTSANPKAISSEECNSFAGQKAMIDSTEDAGKVNGIVFKNFKFTHTYAGYNLTRKLWVADYIYTAKNGKVYHNKVHGDELVIKGMKIAYGSFTNGYCEGYYKKTF